MNQEYFSVQLAPEINLGIPLANMGAVIQLEVNNICPVPGVAAFWYGVVNFKGSLLWVLDSDRYFHLVSKQKLKRKLTAVVLKYDPAKSSRQIALVTQQLIGITTLKAQHEEISENISSNLKNCCSASAVTEAKNTYILNPANLSQQLHQQSSLISA
ncbi:chemotaxis protein CheW [Pleurocapsa sp. FMAR1]|uniref:chemotaxis protein CheW n=1 Tax=Pleurocapsa sp. FMAR1 TaxID=3040204 RepID=UPI0029C6EFAD|nr:chemotaxis protein CheW [Pleurocapsa sp. FMAR1]